MTKISIPGPSSKMADVPDLKTSRRCSKGPSSTATVVLVAAMLVLIISPTDAYFMKCKHFCSMLTKDELKQLWCIYDMCRNDKLGRHLLRFAKRSDVASPAFEPLLDGSYNAGRDLSHGRKQRFSTAPGGNPLLRTIAQARKALEDRRPSSPAEDKRDVEYWDGPAPADINA